MKQLFLAPLLALVLSNALACAEHDLPDAGSSVQVAETSVITSKNDGPLLVTVLGTLKNTTGKRIENLVIEAKLTDASGKVIDVLSERVYGLVVPAGQDVAFRLQAPAAAGPDAYAGARARVVSAEAHAPFTPRAAKSVPHPVIDLLVSWGPMILLIAVWLFMMRRYSGKGSTQDKMLAAIGEQNTLLARQIAAIESIAAAASTRKPTGDT